MITDKNVGLTDGSSPLTNSQNMLSEGSMDNFKLHQATTAKDVDSDESHGYHPKNPKQVIESLPITVMTSKEEVELSLANIMKAISSRNKEALIEQWDMLIF
jgi:hypothetical protein